VFKIEFNPRLCLWEIKIQRWIFFWITVKPGNRTLDCYDKAVSYAAELGLGKVYKNASGPRPWETGGSEANNPCRVLLSIELSSASTKPILEVVSNGR